MKTGKVRRKERDRGNESKVKQDNKQIRIDEKDTYILGSSGENDAGSTQSHPLTTSM